MQEVLIKLGEAGDELAKLQKQEQERLYDVINREMIVKKREESAAQKDQELREREAAVANIENYVNLKETATKLFEEANSRMEQASAAQEKLAQDMRLSTDKLNDLREMAQREQSNVESRKHDMEKEVGERVERALINLGIKKA